MSLLDAEHLDRPSRRPPVTPVTGNKEAEIAVERMLGTWIFEVVAAMPLRLELPSLTFPTNRGPQMILN